MERYKRNISSISKAQQDIISNTKVAIVGLGGLGGYVLENLVRLGVNNFNLIDSDVFEESNLNRQILATEKNLGRFKADQAFKRILDINSSSKARVFNYTLNEDSFEMLEGVDIVFDCLDSIESRFQLESLCDKMKLPLIHGAIRGYYGQVAISIPNSRIFKDLYKNVKKEDETLGNLPMTCMITSSFQVNLFLKIISGETFKRELVLIDVKEMEIDKFDI